MSAAAWSPGLVFVPEGLTPKVIAQIKSALPVAETLAITCWREAEARLEGGHWVPNPVEAMIDILEVIHHRANDTRWRALGFKGICLQRWQFSCWEPTGGPDDPKDSDTLGENFELVMDISQRLIAGTAPVGKLADCLSAARRCVDGQLPLTMPPGTCHYYAVSMPKPPTWANGRTPVAERFGHRFYANVP